MSTPPTGVPQPPQPIPPRIPENTPVLPTAEEGIPAGFRPIEIVGAHKVSPLRYPSGGTLYPTGLFPLNRAATDGVLRLSGANADQRSVGIFFGINEEKQEIVCRFLTTDKARLVPFRYNQKRKTCTLYLHDVFCDCPELRPTRKQDVSVSFRPGNGYEYMVIHLALALDKAKSTSPAQSAGTQQAAAAKQQPEQANQPAAAQQAPEQKNTASGTDA